MTAPTLLGLPHTRRDRDGGLVRFGYTSELTLDGVRRPSELESAYGVHACVDVEGSEPDTCPECLAGTCVQRVEYREGASWAVLIIHGVQRELN